MQWKQKGLSFPPYTTFQPCVKRGNHRPSPPPQTSADPHPLSPYRAPRSAEAEGDGASARPAHDDGQGEVTLKVEGSLEESRVSHQPCVSASVSASVSAGVSVGVSVSDSVSVSVSVGVGARFSASDSVSVSGNISRDGVRFSVSDSVSVSDRFSVIGSISVSGNINGDVALVAIWR